MKKQVLIIYTLLLISVLSACRVGNGDKPLIGGIQQRTSVDGREASSESREADSDHFEIPAPLTDRPEQLLVRKAYTVSYNKTMRQPNWVAWHLTKDHTKGSFKRDGVKFQADDDVPEPRADDWDYYGSGYDRGHMCPAGDNKWDATAMRETFLLSNICPQNHLLNKNGWNDLEIQCRKWAQHYGSIYIVCGPIFHTGTHKTIGKNKVAVPDAFFKVVMRFGDRPAAIAFIYKNEDGSRSMDDYVNTLAQVERITGIRFRVNLPDVVRNEFENKADLSDWR